MRQQRIGVNRVGVLLVAGEQEQALAIKPGGQILPAQLHDIMTFSLALAGMQPAGQVGEGKA
ncbi:Uncharacterised protein [Klebsiella pneumoniae]|nr:Uncharacterised protein [Klebsiella pneumoniae]